MHCNRPGLTSETITPQVTQVCLRAFDHPFKRCSNPSPSVLNLIVIVNQTERQAMTKSLKQVIETLIAQGFTLVQVRETLAAESWFDSSVERFLSTL